MSLIELRKCPLRITAAVFITFLVTAFIIFWFFERLYSNRWYNYWSNYYTSKLASEVATARAEAVQYKIFTGVFSYNNDPSRNYDSTTINLTSESLDSYSNPAPVQAVTASADLVPFFETASGAPYNRNKVYVLQETQTAAYTTYYNIVIDEARGKARIVAYADIPPPNGLANNLDTTYASLASTAAILAESPENVTISASISSGADDEAALTGTTFDQTPLAKINLYGPTAPETAGSDNQYAMTPEFDISPTTDYTFANVEVRKF